MNYDVSFVSSDAAHSPLCDPTIRFYTIPLSNGAIVNNTAHANANVTQLNATYSRHFQQFFGVKLSNDVREILKRQTLVAMATKFGIKLNFYGKYHRDVCA